MISLVLILSSHYEVQYRYLISGKFGSTSLLQRVFKNSKLLRAHSCLLEITSELSQSQRECLVYLSDGDVPYFRVSFSTILSRTRYQKEGKFSGAGCQNMLKEKILLQRVII